MLLQCFLLYHNSKITGELMQEVVGAFLTNKQAE